MMQAHAHLKIAKQSFAYIRGASRNSIGRLEKSYERLWTLLGRLPRNWNSLQRDWHPTRGSRMGLRGYQDSRPKVCIRRATLGNNNSRGTMIMDYKVKLNWQEDEFASRGTTYFVEFLKMDDTSLGEMDGNSWQEVFTKAVNYLQEIGEI